MTIENVAPLDPGLNLFGYEIKSVLGQGGFGIIYLAIELETGAQVVLKENKPGVGATRKPGELAFNIPAVTGVPGKGGAEWSEENFINEANNQASVRHKGVMPVKKVFKSEVTRTAYYVMPYVESKTLKQICEMSNARTRQWVMYLAACMLEALEAVHNANLLHRDLKPANILISTTGQPLLIDFGSARKRGRDSYTCLVSENYSPIEQRRGEGEGPWTDIYAMGATIYYMVTGKEVPELALRGGIKDDYVPLAGNAELEKVFGRRFLESVDKALAYEPEARFQTATAWIEYLRGEADFQSTYPVLFGQNQLASAKVQIGGTEVLIQKKKNKKVLWIALAVVLLLLAAIVVLLAMSTCQHKEETVIVKPPSREVARQEKELIMTPPPPPVKVVHETKSVIMREGARLYSPDTPGNGSYTEAHGLRVFFVKETVTTPGGACYYKVSAMATGDAQYSVSADEVYQWDTRVALRFAPRLSNQTSGLEKRMPAVLFSSASNAKDFVSRMTSAERHGLVDDLSAIVEQGSQSGKTVPEGVLAMEPREGTWRFWMPVLDSDPDVLTYKMDGSGLEGNTTNVVKVASMAVPLEENLLAKGEVERTVRKIQAVDIVFVIDTTKSMGPYLEGVLEMVKSVAEDLKKDTGEQDIALRIGLVGYRDWKAVKDDGTVEDKTFTRKMGYVVKYYNDGNLLTAPEFISWLESKKGSSEYPVATEVDSIDYAEDVQAGLDAAITKTKWVATPNMSDADGADKKPGLRVVWLIGDAGGRSPGMSEHNELNWRNQYSAEAMSEWNHRPAGSLVKDASVQTLKMALDAYDVKLVSTFILTVPNNSVTLDNWLTHFQKPSIEQFCQLSTMSGSVSEADVPACTIYNPVRKRMKDGYFEKMKTFLTQEMYLPENIIHEAPEIEYANLVKDDFSEYVTEILRSSIQSIQKRALDRITEEDSQSDAGESAISRMFACAYMDWLGSQQLEVSADKNVPQPKDFAGWLPDSAEQSGTMVLAHVVLTRRQIQMLEAQIEALLSDFDKSYENKTDAENQSVKDTSGAMVSVLTNILAPSVDSSAPARDDHAVFVSRDDRRTREEKLKVRISKLPFPTATMQKYADENLVAGNVQDAQQKLRELLSKLRQVVAGVESSPSSTGIMWSRDPNGDKDEDCFYLPLRDLP